MSITDMPEYLNEINRLKEKYKDRIEIYTGLEIDYLDDTYNASIPYFQDLPLDFRISSVHFMPWKAPLLEENMTCIDGSTDEFLIAVEERYQGSIRSAVQSFYHSSMRMVELGGFDIVGHMDKIYMNAGRHADFDIKADWYHKLVETFIDLIAEKELIVEINTKNYLRKQQTFPHTDLFSLLYKHRIPVMVNTDSHFPDLINAGRTDVLKLLKATGYQTTRELVAGKWEDIEIK
jgi:histidinol-phosphatase (PHP family)